MKNLHTFIIPVYNGSPMLAECIQSLFEQTIKSSILITTSTPSLSLFKIAKNYNIEVIVNKNRVSISEDWNFAYRHCKTKYLTLAHQDDIYLPDYTQTCLEYGEKNRDNLIIFTKYKEVGEDQIEPFSPLIMIKNLLLFPYYFKYNCKSNFIKKMTISFGSPICCPSVMFNIENIGAFSFSNTYHINLDWDAWLRLSRFAGSFIFVKKILMLHRVYQSSTTTQGILTQQRKLEDELMFARVLPKIVSAPVAFLYRISYLLNKM